MTSWGTTILQNVGTCQSTGHIPKKFNLHQHRCIKLKSRSLRLIPAITAYNLKKYIPIKG